LTLHQENLPEARNLDREHPGTLSRFPTYGINGRWNKRICFWMIEAGEISYKIIILKKYDKSQFHQAEFRVQVIDSYNKID
jgi:hypothetical protein